MLVSSALCGRLSTKCSFMLSEILAHNLIDLQFSKGKLYISDDVGADHSVFVWHCPEWLCVYV